MLLEPLARQPRHLVQSTGLLEEMRRPGDDREPLLASQLCERCLVQFDDLEVVAADDEQSRRPHLWQERPGQIRPATA